jgi:hypothetical protein
MNGSFAKHETLPEEAARAQAPGRSRRGFEGETPREDRVRRDAAIDEGFRQRGRRAPREVDAHRKEVCRNPARPNGEDGLR